MWARSRDSIYQALIAEAHARGLRVAAHIHDLADAKAIVRAGVDILAHGVRDAPVDDELIQMMKERSVWYVPTLSLTLATRDAAALLRLEDRGVLAPGRWADLVVLEGDPSTAISQTTKIHAVWHRGKQAAGPIGAFKP